MQHLSDDKLAEQEAKVADWWKQIEQWRERKCLAYKKDESLIKPQEVIESLYKHTNGDAYVSSDVGQDQMFAALYYPFAKPRRWIKGMPSLINHVLPLSHHSQGTVIQRNDLDWKVVLQAG